MTIPRSLARTLLTLTTIAGSTACLQLGRAPAQASECAHTYNAEVASIQTGTLLQNTSYAPLPVFTSAHDCGLTTIGGGTCLNWSPGASYSGFKEAVNYQVQVTDPVVDSSACLPIPH